MSWTKSERTVYSEENICIVIGGPEVRKAENLKPVTGQPAQFYQCTQHKALSVFLKRYENGLSHRTKGFQETLERHR